VRRAEDLSLSPACALRTLLCVKEFNVVLSSVLCFNESMVSGLLRCVKKSMPEFYIDLFVHSFIPARLFKSTTTQRRSPLQH